MKVKSISGQRILRPCNLEWFTYQIDPYIGCEHQCSYCYTLSSTPYGDEILFHSDIASQLSKELAVLDPQTVYMGMDTDPYQPAEEDLGLTRQTLELLARNHFSVCILTKSDMVTRDIDLLKKMPGSSAGISIAFHDESVRRLFESGAPSNERRLLALKALKEAGIETYVLISPVMPYITDSELLIRILAPLADTIWLYSLRIETEEEQNWRNISVILDHHFPGVGEKYHKIVFSTNHPYWIQLRESLTNLQKEKGINLRIEL